MYMRLGLKLISGKLNNWIVMPKSDADADL